MGFFFRRIEARLSAIEGRLASLAGPGVLEERLARNRVASVTQGVQLLLAQAYREALRARAPLPALQDAEFRCYSQNGEDGIIQCVFSLVGVRSRVLLEIGTGNGTECNGANLIINHGWRALLLDGDPASVASGQAFYSSCQDTFSQPPTLRTAWVTAENVNSLIEAERLSGDIDLFSLDIDGMDYWIWKALECVSPRLVVLEFNPVWGPELALSVPYRPDFRLDTSRTPYYCGASLPAFVKLGRRKGYRLIGVERLGFNAFFLRDDVGQEVFPEVTAARCFAETPSLRRWEPGWIPTAAARPEFGEVVEV